MTAQEVGEQIRKNLGAPWRDQSCDIFHAGKPEDTVSGIVTTYAATFEVLRRAAAGGKNMIVSRESPFWDRGRAENTSGAGAPPGRELMLNDPVYRAKKRYMDDHNLVVWRFYDHWAARKQDGQLLGLAKALGWEKYYRPSREPWTAGSGNFVLPPATLRAAAKTIKARLAMRGMRVLGDPSTKISKAALSHGLFLVPELKTILESDPDLIVVGEPVEWEAAPYFQDLIASGKKKGMIILWQEVSEEPGSGEVAAWLRSFLTGIPIEWIPAGEPVWMTPQEAK
jgi:putative NIF3 family GTP cyclohydrolase 1 type 2